MQKNARKKKQNPLLPPNEPAPIETQEISAEELGQKFALRHPIMDGKLHELPLTQPWIDWEDFEKLCARLLQSTYGSEISQAFRYGFSGHAQHGIDIVALQPKLQTIYVAQCKHVQRISEGDLTAWVAEFTQGARCQDVKKYIFCTSFSVESKPALVEEWKQCSFALAKNNIDSELWDHRRLQDLLRGTRSLVAEAFGEVAADRFCVSDTTTIPSPFPEIFRARYVEPLRDSVVIENISVRIDLILPGAHTPGVSGLLSFARSDLNGVALALDSDELVSWLQWRHNTTALCDRPYAPKVANQDQWVFTSKTARLILGPDEMEHLDWALASAWPHFIQAASAREAAWKTLRFPRLEDQCSETAYGLAKVNRQLWRSMIAFANAHDCAAERSDWHIFDGVPGMIKVFVKEDTQSLDAGYHAFLDALNEPGIWLPWEDDVVIAWKQMTTSHESGHGISPRKYWDVEYTHDWLLQSFIPEVIAWERRRRLPSKKPIWPWQPDRPEKVDNIDAWCHSCSLTESRAFSASPDNIGDVRDLAEQLQRHFHAGTRHPPTHDRLTKNVLRALHRIIPFAARLDDYYVRSKLPLDRSLNIGPAIGELAESSTELAGRAWLDLALRCLCVVLEDTSNAPRHELNYVLDMLKPTWDQFREDILCRSAQSPK